MMDRIPNRVENYLILWAAWYRSCKPKLGYPSASIGIETGGINCYDDLEHQVDSYAAVTVDKLIGDLTASKQCAVRWAHLGEPWRFSRQNEQELYDQACEDLEMGLNRWGLA
jgi:hypothetical protein